MTINAAAVLYLIGAIVAFIAVFTGPYLPRHNLMALAVGFIGVGLFCQATGLGA